MIINGKALLRQAPIKDMCETKVREHGVSHGLAEVGYDIRIKQDVEFRRKLYPAGYRWDVIIDGEITTVDGRFCIASAMEEFQMSPDLVGVVHDKSTWARHGLSVFNTVIEPGWQGFLTLELVYHGNDDLFIPAGAGIAQVLFSEILAPASYDGKYANQPDRPVPAILE